jgi:hypothetical protein
MIPDFECLEQWISIDGQPPVFWMVWNQNGQAPTRVHHRRKSAVKEAERLARKQPSDRFFVLRAESAVETTLPPTKITELVEAPF